MKPEQFIREFGVEKAREALTLCCWMDGSFCTRLWHGCVQNNHECCVDVAKLKRLVESVDQINAFDGGIKEAKKILSRINKHGSKYATLFERPALEQAIRDYESIYGGGE